MKACILSLWIFLFHALVIGKPVISSAAAIGSAENATHIVRITGDTIIVIMGSTYLFTVDTPADEGLVSTAPTVEELIGQIKPIDGSEQKYIVKSANGAVKYNGKIEQGDKLIVTSQDGKSHRAYFLQLRRAALTGKLNIKQPEIKVNTKTDITLCFTAGQRSPDTEVRLFIPAEINFSEDNATVNVIGRGDVKLRDFEKQSIGRTGTNYSYSKVGRYEIAKNEERETVLIFSNLDLRPANGADVEVTLHNVILPEPCEIKFRAQYITSAPEKLTSAGIGTEEAVLPVRHNTSGTTNQRTIDIKEFHVIADGNHDNTDRINEAIDSLHKSGGGTLIFSEGIYSVRTVHLQSNITLYIGKGATIKALKGADAPETTWFSDRAYRSGLSPTDTGPYDDPENYLTKQDVGHTYFRNTMFFGERLDNVKIIGNGRITGDGNLVNGDRVMNNDPDNRADKMFTFKLCTNIEIGGLYRGEDLWYDEVSDEPYYIGKDGAKDFNCDNMLDIDRGGHFVLLATGSDNIYVHNTYLGRYNTSNVRDIYDFMGCNNVTVTNIYCKVSSDDIVKLGSDCSLGFTRPVRNYKVRNIIGDTNCNLFQIGSETADDITDVCVDNIYVLGANKAGFSISTNDGAHVKNIHLNCGHTGKIHSRSKMLRSATPFFISISNRGRVIGADAARFRFEENGAVRDELLCTNVDIGEVENIILKGVDISEVYGGSSFRGDRWKDFDGTQRKASPIVAGYKLPDPETVEGGLNFRLPNGKHTGYITDITFSDINVLVKGGNPSSDAQIAPKELGVGQYNVSNLGIQPSYGLWARHVKGLTVDSCSFNYETRDSRYALFLDDVKGAEISAVKMVRAEGAGQVVRFLNSSGITLKNNFFYNDKWGQSLTAIPDIANQEFEKP